MQWPLEALRDDEARTVFGGDFNSWVRGADESAVRMLQKWRFVPGSLRGQSSWILPPRLRRLDHVFYRLPSGATAHTRQLEDTYGSDHRPLLGWIQLADQELVSGRTRLRLSAHESNE